MSSTSHPITTLGRRSPAECGLSSLEFGSGAGSVPGSVPGAPDFLRHAWWASSSCRFGPGFVRRGRRRPGFPTTRVRRPADALREGWPLRSPRGLWSDAELQRRTAEARVIIVTADSTPDRESRVADEIVLVLSEQCSRKVVTRALQYRAGAKGVQNATERECLPSPPGRIPRRETADPPETAASVLDARERGDHPVARAVLNSWMDSHEVLRQAAVAHSAGRGIPTPEPPAACFESFWSTEDCLRGRRALTANDGGLDTEDARFMLCLAFDGFPHLRRWNRRTSAVGSRSYSSCRRRRSSRRKWTPSRSARRTFAGRRTGRADFPHPALGRDHAFAHGRLVVRVPRRVSLYSFQSRSSGNRT